MKKRTSKNPFSFLLRGKRGPVWFLISATLILLTKLSVGSLPPAFTQAFQPAPTVQDIRPNQMEVCFTPGQLCLPKIRRILAQAKQSIHLQACSFSQSVLVKDLIDAARRGVKVILIFDKSQRTAKYTKVNLFKGTRIQVFFDDKPAIAHNKVIIVDDKIVVTGSYNFTQAAETKNAENLLMINCPKIAAIYEQNFQNRLKESVEQNSFKRLP